MSRGGLYLALGDSTTWTIPSEPAAIGDSLYTNRIWRAINANYAPCHYVNKGFGGNTSTTLLSRLPIHALCLPYDLVTICVGMNDCYNNQVPSATFQSNLETIVDRLRIYRPDCEIILLSVMPTNEAGRVDNVAAYNAAIAAVVASKSVLTCDVSAAYSDFASYAPDGIHPNTAGHELVFDLVWPVVQGTSFVAGLSS